MNFALRYSLSLAVSAVVSTAGLATGQTFYRVDQANGPGTHFTTIAPAIAAAAPGDVIHVFAGTYSLNSLDIAKGISIVGMNRPTILALPTVGQALTVRDLSIFETFTMRGFDLSGTLLTTNISIERCAGKVFIRDVAIVSASGGWTVADSPQVILENCSTQRGSPAISVTGSEVVANGCLFQSPAGFGVSVDGSKLDLVETEVRGGGLLLGSPGLRLLSGDLRVAGGSIEAGSGLAASPTSAIQATSGTIQIGPTAALLPLGGGAPVSGFANVSNVDFPFAFAEQTPTQLTITASGTPGDSYATIITLPPFTKLPSPFGDFWIEPAVHLVIDSGIFPGTREVMASLTYGGADAGFAVLAQAVQISPGAVTLSNPALVITP